jgi:methylglyoxal synthase
MAATIPERFEAKKQHRHEHNEVRITTRQKNGVEVKKRIALIAHDKKKDDMIELASKYADLLRQCLLVATGTTGKRLSEEVGLTVERKLSGPFGGDLQIGAELAEGRVDAVIFLRDPMTPQPHEPDINALVRACDVHNIPCATNVVTASMLLAQIVPHHHHHN